MARVSLRPDPVPPTGDRSGTGGPAGAAPERGPAWTAAAVARHLGVSPATLRSWSARYGIGPRGHEAGRHRRFTDADVAVFVTMCRLRGQGMPMGTAAQLARETPPETAIRPRPSPARPAPPMRQAADHPVDALVTAARRLDAESIMSIVAESITGQGSAVTWNELCRPALARTGPPPTAADGPRPGPPPADPDEDPLACIDAECVLTWAISSCLRRPRALPPRSAPGPRALLACAEGEQHTLAMEALAAALPEEGLPVRVLGPSVPWPAIDHAARHASTAVLFVWAQTGRTARPGRIARLEPHAPVAAAGPGWAARRLPDGVERVESLEGALRVARRVMSAGVGDRSPAAP
ncbi:MerR HTH family regulatory protein [Pseudonocardia ammonioxydans]|uniref:MerR HTH family regulatory protein n=1 Tax=Pseudonocardia ammonioxydans TaxID=260086 RepID=A0A1I4XP21_PSUAM|nr:MerR HTH family regulatory protein [Pseudonocardia ammonioxydans]